MTIFKCAVGLSDGFCVICDGIEHDEKLWLVPGWLESKSEPIAIPKRMIRFDNHPHQKDNDSQSALDYQNILLPISEAGLLGKLPSSIEYIDKPANVSVPIHELRKH